MKQVKWVLGVMLIVGFVASQALAATTNVNYTAAGRNFIQAAETTGTTRNLTLTGLALNDAGNATVNMVLGQTLNTSSLIQLSLTGGLTFVPGLVYNVCVSNLVNGALNAGNTIGTFTALSNSNNQMISLNAAVIGAAVNAGAGASVWFTNILCNNATAPGGAAANFQVQSPAGIGIGSKQIFASVVTSGNIPIDPSTTGANIVSVVREFPLSFTTRDLIGIDYLSSPFDGTHTAAVANISSNTIGASNSKLVLGQTAGVDLRTNSGALSAGLTVNEFINLLDSDNWANVTRIYATDTNTCTGANNTIASVVPTAGANVTLPMVGIGAFNGSLNTITTVCVQVNGANVIGRKSITGNYTFTGAVPPPSIADFQFQLWMPNGYQAFNPYMYVGADQASDVFNRFFNESTRTAQVFAEVWPANGSVSQTIPLAAIPPRSAGTYWAADIGAAAGLAVGTSYAARFTVTVQPNQVNGVSYMKRSSGSERQLPLYKDVTVAGYTLE